VLGMIAGALLLLLSPVRRVKSLGARNLLRDAEGRG
jgi:hypothetical protein